MSDENQTFYQQVNHARFQGQPQGFYESFFLRANHPARPLAFWIRYTLFCPKDQPEKAIGELWAVFFNAETGQHAVAKDEYRLSDCLFDPTTFGVRVGAAMLGPHALQGAIQGKGHTLAWDLAFAGDSAPILLLPLKLYQGGFPAAKSLVSLPMARFNGNLTVNGEAIPVSDWLGSQNHNWGRRHTDRYAWGQVAGFDTHPQSFLEVATARLRAGSFWLPALTPLVLRHQGKEYACTELLQGARAHGAFEFFTWEFKTGNAEVEIEGLISAPPQAFVGLSYHNPPGGEKHCLNSKIASCRLTLTNKATGKTETLETKHRAAFEILTDERDHGITISA